MILSLSILTFRNIVKILEPFHRKNCIYGMKATLRGTNNGVKIHE